MQKKQKRAKARGKQISKALNAFSVSRDTSITDDTQAAGGDLDTMLIDGDSVSLAQEGDAAREDQKRREIMEYEERMKEYEECMKEYEEREREYQQWRHDNLEMIIKHEAALARYDEITRLDRMRRDMMRELGESYEENTM